MIERRWLRTTMRGKGTRARPWQERAPAATRVTRAKSASGCPASGSAAARLSACGWSCVGASPCVGAPAKSWTVPLVGATAGPTGPGALRIASHPSGATNGQGQPRIAKLRKKARQPSWARQHESGSRGEDAGPLADATVGVLSSVVAVLRPLPPLPPLRACRRSSLCGYPPPPLYLCSHACVRPRPDISCGCASRRETHRHPSCGMGRSHLVMLVAAMPRPR